VHELGLTGGIEREDIVEGSHGRDITPRGNQP
jgi:hypothetical protein